MSCPPLWVAGSSLHFQHLQDSCGFEPMMVEYLKIIQMWVHVHPLMPLLFFPWFIEDHLFVKERTLNLWPLWHPPSLGTLGCLADGKNWGCRWCGFGEYANVTCPSSTCTFDNEPVTPYYWDTWTLKTSKLEKQSKSVVLRETWVANDYCKLYPQSSLRKN